MGLSALLLLALAARADIKIHPDAGTTSAAFLKVAVGARPVAMGEAFTAVSGDANGLLWNPAGLAELGTNVFAGTHNESFESIRSDFGVYVRPLSPTASGERRTLALHVLTLIPPGQDSRSGSGEDDPFNPITTPDGTFGAYSAALGASYAQTFGPDWALGGTLQLIRESIASDSAQTIAVNLGAQRRTKIRGLTLGAALLNFGPGTKFVNTSYPLPTSLRLGAAYKPPAAADKLLLTFDATVPNDDYLWLSGGAELSIIRSLTLRAGYKYRWYGDPLGGTSGLRVGGGFRFNEIRLDYAFAPFGDLGSQHRISISVPWGKAPDRPQPARLEAPPMPSIAAPAETLPPSAFPAAAPSGPASGYAVQSKLLAITPQGVVFNVKASTAFAAAAIQETTFRAVAGGPVTFGFDVEESPGPVAGDVIPSSVAVYRVLSVRQTPRLPLRGVSMRLSIDSTWLKSQGLRADKAVLFRVQDGKGVPQVTILKEEAGGRASYEALPDQLGETWVLGVERPQP